MDPTVVLLTFLHIMYCFRQIQCLFTFGDIIKFMMFIKSKTPNVHIQDNGMTRDLSKRRR